MKQERISTVKVKTINYVAEVRESQTQIFHESKPDYVTEVIRKQTEFLSKPDYVTEVIGNQSKQFVTLI